MILRHLNSKGYSRLMSAGVPFGVKMGTDIARGLWVYQSGERIFLLRIFIKKSPKTPPTEIERAFRRLEEMQNEI
ncbi:type II toxin-antitoxin system RelE/ParE family toxin [Salmonella enterica]